MAYNTARGLAVSLRQIKRFGAKAYLRRDNIDRVCWAGIVDYRPRDVDLHTEGSQRALIAAKGLTIHPDRELDTLVFKGKTYRFSAPIRGPRPNGTALFFDCEVVYDSSDT